MKVVVTGSSGYIGSVLAQKLVEQGHDVTGIDLIPNNNKNLKNFYLSDYSNEFTISKTMLNADVVFHMAASSLLGPSVYDPISYYYNNNAKTSILLHQLIKNNFRAKFIFASSAAVYGNKSIRCDDSFFDETFMPINPYGKTKYQTEKELNDIGIANDFDFLAFRFFNVCGAYKNFGQQLNYPHIITSISRSAFAYVPFTINGNDFDTPDGTCVRDYIHVEDVVDLLIQASTHSRKEILHNFCNICTGVGTSNLEIANMFSTLTKEKLDIEFGPMRDGDPDYLVGSPYTMKNQFSFEPKHNMEEIIKSAWNYYKRKMKENNGQEI